MAPRTSSKLSVEESRQARALQKRDADWSAIYPVFRVSPGWVIAPPERSVRARSSERVLRIRPTMTYGSGGNVLTAAALQAIPDLCRGMDLKKARILDLGCGSGVLAIACAKLGFTQVDGMDISRPALQEATENALATRVSIRWMERLRAGRRYDLILANLYGVLFMDYLPRFASLLTPGGRICAVGFDAVQAVEILPAYAAAGFKLIESTSHEGWQRVIWQKPDGS